MVTSQKEFGKHDTSYMRFPCFVSCLLTLKEPVGDSAEPVLPGKCQTHCTSLIFSSHLHAHVNSHTEPVSIELLTAISIFKKDSTATFYLESKPDSRYSLTFVTLLPLQACFIRASCSCKRKE